jgi:hypothetical protein
MAYLTTPMALKMAGLLAETCWFTYKYKLLLLLFSLALQPSAGYEFLVHEVS